MRVFTPASVAQHTGSKYLGVLVAAKYSRELNSLPRETLPLGEEKKLTTRSLEALTSDRVPPGGAAQADRVTGLR